MLINPFDHKRFRNAFTGCACTAGLVLACCSSSDLPPRDVTPAKVDDSAVHRVTFSLPGLDPGCRLDTLLELDLNDDGGLEYVVTTLDTSEKYPSGGRADRLRIYSWDPASHAYRPVAEDTLRWITGIEIRDVTGDGGVDVVVSRNAGGTDPVATNGASVYSGQGGTIRSVLSIARGAPRFVSIPSVNGIAVQTYGRLWPPLVPMTLSVPYLDDILGYRGDRFGSLRSEQPERFLSLAHDAEYDYRRLRQRHVGDTLRYTDSVVEALRDSLIDEGSPLFTPAALILLGYGRAGREESLRNFWHRERNYLQRRMPERQWTALDSIYQRTLAQGSSADPYTH